jgi:hypothetical protein
VQRRLPKLGFMFRFEGTIRHCLLWRARSHRHDDLRDTTAETYRARALFPPLLLDHADRVASVRRESGRLPQPRTPVIMGPDRSLSSGGAMRRPGGRDDVACVARSHRMHCLAFSFQTAAPRSCSHPLVASCGEGWRQRQCLWQPQPSPTRGEGARRRRRKFSSLRSIRGYQRMPPPLRGLPSDPTCHSRLPASGRSPRLLCSVHAFRAISAPDLACNGLRVGIA